MTLKRILIVIPTLLLLGLVGVGMGLLFIVVWGRFTSLNPELAAALFTAGATVLGATLTTTLGRYYETKKEIAAHFREKKSIIYDAFLKELFKVFGSTKTSPNLVPFLREWQRQMFLWGGPGVMKSYLRWRDNLAKGVPDAQFNVLNGIFHS